MNDAFGNPQCVVVLGGTSDIAGALIERLAQKRCRTVVLAGRNEVELQRRAAALEGVVPRVRTVPFDAITVDGVDRTIDACATAAGEPVDLVVVAVGELGEQARDEVCADRAAAMVTVNMTWPVAAMVAVAELLKRQGTGRLVVLSSVAGYRVRRANFVYGAAKAGLDSFALGLAESLRGTGVVVHVVRPGFVRTKMTSGRPPGPFAVSPERVARDIARGMERGEATIWSPRFLRWVFGVLRLLPTSIWRRLPG